MERAGFRILIVVIAACLSCGGAIAGMAELGHRRNLNLGPGPEAGSDLAQGGGVVVLTVEGQAFSHDTVVGDTVTSILQDLAGQINASRLGLAATHQAGDDEISVTRGGAEIGSLAIRSSDAAFGFIRVMRSRRAAVALKGISQPPAGDGRVQIIIDDQLDRAATVATSDHAGDADSLNDALVAALVGQGFDAVRAGALIRVTMDQQSGQSPMTISLEESDTGSPVETITDIEVISADEISVDAHDVPTLSPWGLVLQIALLGGATLHFLRRRRGAGRPA